MTRLVKLRYEEGFKPVQPDRHPVPYHYQERLTTIIKQFHKDDNIQKVDTEDNIDCILNVSISEKRTQGGIQMDIDARLLNEGAKLNGHQGTTPQETRLKMGAPRSSVSSTWATTSTRNPSTRTAV